VELLLIGSGCIGLAAAGAVVLWWLRSEAAAQAAAPPPPAPEVKVAKKASPPPPLDDEITIVTFQPMLLDGNKHEEPEPEAAPDGPPDAVNAIVRDPGAGDDEPSAAQPLILLSAVAQSHPGRKRKNNEDSFLVSERHHLFVVADGMGGYAGGEVASAMACDTIAQTYDDESFGEVPLDLPQAAGQLVAAIRRANTAILDRARAEPELQGMGTTLVAARFSPRKERVYIGHVGDSRVYRLRKGALEQLTTDHTLASLGVEGPQSHSLTRALGVAPTVEVDLLFVEPAAGDCYLLCSDGLTKMVPEASIREVLAAADDAQIAVQALIDNANARGGRDNITAVVVQVRDLSTMDVQDDPESPAATG
jgi:serine/threonine protein phosphatase PrpC